MSQTCLRKSVSRLLFALLPAAGTAWVALIASGCQTTLEDGYKPHSLDASPDMRKSFYASPFTDSAEAGAKDSGPAFRPGK